MIQKNNQIKKIKYVGKVIIILLILLIIRQTKYSTPEKVYSQGPFNLNEYIAGPGFTPHSLSTGEYIHFEAGPSSGGVKQFKNDNYEQFFIQTDGVYRREDTSWAPLPGFNDALCANGNKAIYALDPGCDPNPFPVNTEVTTNGAFWAPSVVSEFETWPTGAHQIVPIDSGTASGSYNYSSIPPLVSCEIENMSGYPACVSQGNQILELSAHYQANEYTFCTGSTNPTDIIVITVLSGPGLGDTFYYGRNYGLMGFEASGFEAGYLGPDGDSSQCSGGSSIPGTPPWTNPWGSCSGNDVTQCTSHESPNRLGCIDAPLVVDPDCPGIVRDPTIYPIPTVGAGTPTIPGTSCVRFTKTPNPQCTTETGDITVSFVLNIQNLCADDLTGVTITDTHVGTINLPDIPSGSQESSEYTVSFAAGETMLTNTATLNATKGSNSYTDMITANVVRANDCSLSYSCFVDVTNPEGVWGSYPYGGSYPDGDLHHGIDWLAPAGTDVFAAIGGNVLFSGWGGDDPFGEGPGYGYVIRIMGNDGRMYFYGHLDPTDRVSTGLQVMAGQRIAAIGPLCLDPAVGNCYNGSYCTNNCQNGFSTISHVHFEIREAPFIYSYPNDEMGDTVDPADLGICSPTTGTNPGPNPVGSCANLSQPQPDRNRAAYQAAEAETNVPWQVLNGVHYVETGYGTNISGNPFQIMIKDPETLAFCASCPTTATDPNRNCTPPANSGTCYPYRADPSDPDATFITSAIGAAMFIRTIGYNPSLRGTPAHENNLQAALASYFFTHSECTPPASDNFNICNGSGQALNNVWGLPVSNYTYQYPYAMNGISDCYCLNHIYLYSQSILGGGKCPATTAEWGTIYHEYYKYGTYTAYLIVGGSPNGN